MKKHIFPHGHFLPFIRKENLFQKSPRDFSLCLMRENSARYWQKGMESSSLAKGDEINTTHLETHHDLFPGVWGGGHLSQTIAAQLTSEGNKNHVGKNQMTDGCWALCHNSIKPTFAQCKCQIFLQWKHFEIFFIFSEYFLLSLMSNGKIKQNYDPADHWSVG